MPVSKTTLNFSESQLPMTNNMQPVVPMSHGMYQSPYEQLHNTGSWLKETVIVLLSPEETGFIVGF